MQTCWSHRAVSKIIISRSHWTGCTKPKISCPSSNFGFWIQFEKHHGLYVTNNFQCQCLWSWSAHFAHNFDVTSEAHPNWYLAHSFSMPRVSVTCSNLSKRFLAFRQGRNLELKYLKRYQNKFLSDQHVRNLGNNIHYDKM